LLVRAMAGTDEIAYKVLRSNYDILSIDIDVRRISTEAIQGGIISTVEKQAIWNAANSGGPSAGVKMFLDFLMKNQDLKRVFQLFVELLGRHRDLKFWADCLKGNATFISLGS